MRWYVILIVVVVVIALAFVVAETTRDSYIADTPQDLGISITPTLPIDSASPSW